MLADAVMHLLCDAARASAIVCCRFWRGVSGTADLLNHQGRECAARLIAIRKPYLSAVRAGGRC